MPTMILAIFILIVTLNSLQAFDEKFTEEEDGRFNNTIATYKIGRKLMQYQRSSCYRTQDDKLYPWWSIQLKEISIVHRVLILTDRKRSKHFLHDIEVRVGSTDISQIQEDKLFTGNSICGKKKGIIDSLFIDIECRKYVGGKFLSLQIIKPCVAEGCHESGRNVLRLCEVQVFGVPISKVETGDRTWLTRDAIKNISQSSTAFYGYAAKALKPPTQIVISPNDDYCIGRFTSSTRNDSQTKMSVHYQRNFRPVFLFEKFLLVQQDKIDSRVNWDMTITVDSQLCFGVKNVKTIPREVICRNKLKGKKFEIAFTSTFRNLANYQSPRFLDDCAIEAWGYKVINFAFHQPTIQSSKNTSNSDSYLAVDIATIAYHPIIKDETICLRTADDDLSPWWQVDLLRKHLIKSILVYPGKNELWNFQVRVGDTDLNKVSNLSLLENNHICADYKGRFVAAYKRVQLDCKTPLLGQFLTIHQDASCHTQPCDKENGHVFEFCEVEVFGILVDLYYHGNAATLGDSIITQSYDANMKTTIPPRTILDEQLYNWWMVDLGTSAAAVEDVTLFFNRNITSPAKYRLQIRVGNEKPPSQARSQWLKSNEPCFEARSLIFEGYLFTATCKNAVGRYVFVQYKALDKNNSRTKLFTFAQVWIFKFRPASQFIEGASKKLKNDNWVTDPTAVAVEMFSHIKDTSEEFYATCTHTNPGAEPFPWWQVSLDGVYLVNGFLLLNTKDEQNYRRLHDVELRVGFEDIAEGPRNQPFTGNALCYGTGSSAYPMDKKDHKNIYDCQELVMGNYISVQITKKCNDPQQCNVLEPNILTICFIDWRGQKVLNADESDSNVGKDGVVRQSN